MRSAKLCIFSACLISTIALAGESGIKSIGGSSYRPVVALLGGYANINLSGNRTYIGDDDNVYIYRYNSNSKNTGFLGAFAGVEHALPWDNYFMQLGAEYNYFWSVTATGLHTVGIEPVTSTLYGFSYRFQTQQVLASARFLTTTHQIYHPYAAVGIGAAFNEMNNYFAVTNETGSINLTPDFTSHTRSQFTYNLGAGIDVDVYKNIRVGAGYRFSGFGSGGFSRGRVIVNSDIMPTPFALTTNNAYANQFIAQISYVA